MRPLGLITGSRVGKVPPMTTTQTTKALLNRRLTDTNGQVWEVWKLKAVATDGLWTGLGGTLTAWLQNTVTGQRLELADGWTLGAEKAVAEALTRTA